MELKEKQGVVLTLNESFKEKRRKPQAKQENKNVLVTPWLKNRADSSAYNYLLNCGFVTPKMFLFVTLQGSSFQNY